MFVYSLKINKVRKTVSAEVNYGIRFEQFSDAEKFLDQLSGTKDSIFQTFRVL